MGPRAQVGLAVAVLVWLPTAAGAWLDRMTDVEKAVYYDDEEWLATLLDEGADPNGTGTLWYWDFGMSGVPLVEMAVGWSRSRTLALLLDHGADPNAGHALARAAARNRRAVRLLLEHGAAVDAQTEAGRTPHGRHSVAELLRRNGGRK
jgi:hypothetical protein